MTAQLDGLRRQLVGSEEKAPAHKFVHDGLFDPSKDLGDTTDLPESHPRKLAELTARCAHRADCKVPVASTARESGVSRIFGHGLKHSRVNCGRMVRREATRPVKKRLQACRRAF